MWPFKKSPSQADADEGPSLSPEALFEAINHLNDQVTKFIRWSYRSQKQDSESLANLESMVTTLQARIDKPDSDVTTALDYVARGMIEWLDDLDTVSQDQAQGSWDGTLLQRWSHQLLDRLRAIGYEEIAVEGMPFDPRVCEALGRTDVWNREGLAKAFTVVQVLRRGFYNSDGLYRKAQVVVYNGDEKTSR